MKNKTLVALLAVLILIGGFYVYKIANKKISGQPAEKKQTLSVKDDLTAVDSQGLQISLGQDSIAENLQSVRTLDDISSIEADLQETNLSGIDSELDSIKSDLQGL